MQKITAVLALSAALTFVAVSIANAGGMGQFNQNTNMYGYKGAKVYCGKFGCRPIRARVTR